MLLLWLLMVGCFFSLQRRDLYVPYTMYQVRIGHFFGGQTWSLKPLPVNAPNEGTTKQHRMLLRGPYEGSSEGSFF